MSEEGEKQSLLPNAEDDDDEVEDLGAAVEYALASFSAVLGPVSLSIALASLVVSSFSDPSSSDSDLDVYTEYKSSDVDSVSVRLGKGFLSSLIIVAVLAAATFGIVCLYKFRLTVFLQGYMMLSSAVLLGLMGGVLWWSFLDKYSIPWDSVSFYGVCYNFAIGGVTAIFYSSGVPSVVTQGYLVCTAVLMAWQLSHFEEWTGWCLLVTLALYDLCAVLTPCGPLRALVNLMQEYQTPLPGLLYEASLHSDSKTAASSFADHSPKGEEGPPSGSVSSPDDNRSIKLGLGDFVFYSVLVSKAALFGFATGVSCFLVIIMGLGATLVLLSVYKMALPALPISIALGVLAYLLTRELAVPLLETMISTPFYF